MEQVSLGHGDVTLCVINHNGEQVLGESLGAAVEQVRGSGEVILVDVASEDRSVELVENRFPTVRIVRLPENRGPAAGRNAALEAAQTDLVLLIDNDVQMEVGSVERLAAALEVHPDAAIAMPTVLYAHAPETVQYDGAGCHFLGLQILHGEDRPVASSAAGVRRIGSVVTACILVDRSRLPADLAFDESFFIYFEDHDFGVRARALGREILAVPDARCFHGRGSAGLSIRALGRYSSRRVYCLIRNRWLFLLKNYSLRTLLLLGPILLIYELAQFAIVVKKGWLGEWAGAGRWIVTHGREVLRKRRDIQRSRRLPDRVLLQGGPIPFRQELVASGAEGVARQFLDGLTGAYWRWVEPIL